jgi:hypothetical protein
MDRLGTSGEPLKRQGRRGRSVGINIRGAPLAREQADDAPGPAIERMRQPVERLGGACEMRPLRAVRETQHHERLNGKTRKYRFEIPGLRMECAADRESHLIGAATELVELNHREA